jgi:hypothetical protein
VIELHMFPAMPGRQKPREADARIMGSSASPETVQWLRQVSDPYLRAAEEPGPTSATEFRPGTPPRWLRHADGMRLALAFMSARYLSRPGLREMFRKGLEELPAEVLLYWFTLCFYGYRQLAGRAALRTLFTYQQPEDQGKESSSDRGRKKTKADQGPDLFGYAGGNDTMVNGAGGQGKESARGGRRKKVHASQ